ncbi:MAG TPA: MFS transporter [Companilactobacillus farciminis]|uniref:MFS transporter n=1 Tax=Companilactobacillus farciminis TaxID=1612 RepID=A0A921HPK3_9LACO|nr:MFS transporter [Companilactobacillus farciminis]
MQLSKTKWWVLGTVSLAVFMAMLDITIVNVALPNIQKDFSVTFSSLQWILNAYTLVYAVMLLPVSKLGDRIGRKKVFLGGLFIFIIGSIADGLALNDLWLNIARGFQGIGGAAMMSLSLSIVTTAFPNKQRGLALGIWSSAVGLAVSIGPLIGGTLVNSLGWRSIFWVNVPIGLMAIIMGLFFIKDNTHTDTANLDWFGLITSALLIFSIILGLMQKESHYNYAWTNWNILIWFGTALLALILFIITESKVKNPLIELGLFKSSTFIGANIAAFTLGAGIYGVFTYLSILMQNYMGYSAFETGLKLLVISIFTLILGPITGMLSDKVGNRWLISIALFIGMAGILLINSMLKVPFEWTALYPGFILLGISNATLNPPISNAAMDSVKTKQIGMASGIINVFRQVGISFGIVILGISITNGYTHTVNSSMAHLTKLPSVLNEKLTAILHKTGAFAGQQIFADPRAKNFQQLPIFHQIQSIVYSAFNQGMHQAGIVIAILLAIGGIAALLLVKDKSHNS